MSVDIDISGITASDHFRAFPEAIKAALPTALNDAARNARRLGAAQMVREINFPKGYLDLPNRFVAYPFATNDNPVVRITGRGRGTSLYRFAEGDPTPEATRRRGAGGITVQVKPGVTKTIKGAFAVRLRAGRSITDDNYNLGVAVKVKNGRLVDAELNKYKFDSAQLAGDLYVLYGPSVAQAFDLIAPEIVPEVTSDFADEFRRLFIVALRR